MTDHERWNLSHAHALLVHIHPAVVGATAAQTASAVCLLKGNGHRVAPCSTCWFVHPQQSVYCYPPAVSNCWWHLKKKKEKKTTTPSSVTKFAAAAIIKSHLFTGRAEQFSGETTKEEPNKAIFRWALQNPTLKIFKLRRKSVVALIGGDGDSSLVFSVLPERALGLWYWRLYLFACVCFFFIVHNWNPHGRVCAGTSECGFEVCWHS